MASQVSVMAASQNGMTNGHSQSTPEPALGIKRFSHIPSEIQIPILGEDETVGLDLEALDEDPTGVCTVLEQESSANEYWMVIVMAYAKQGKLDTAIEIINKGLSVVGRKSSDQKLGLFNALCWLQLLKSRQAPRVKLEAGSDVKTKDYYLRQAVATLNEASRINPAYAPLYLPRGVLCLLRAALQQEQSEKSELLRNAVKAFDDALKASKGKNMMAVIGKARAHYSMGKWPEALKGYQTVLEHAPDMTDPDPRIGIGCCWWQLGHKDDASMAWKRALEVNPNSKIANVLLGLYYLNSTSHMSTDDPEFAPRYKKAMVEYTQAAFKMDQDLPLACATFGSYFLLRKAWAAVEKVARRAIELTDVNAVASDGWYLLARKEHYGDDPAKAAEYYAKADQARGGDEKGYLPAKFGAAQLRIMQHDYDGAKFRLEKLIQQSKNIEAMTLLGTLFAEDACNPQTGATREEQINAARKATGLLESVRIAWKDPKRNLDPDASVLLNLARLYEVESPDKALQCLQQVEQMELEEVPDEVRPEESESPEAYTAALREYLPPQLLNNIACFHYQADRLSQAQELFQTALNACIKLGDKAQDTDTDALVTSISYNLARTYEAQNLFDEAKKVYEGLLERHSDYTDAKARLTYIALRQSPTDAGPKQMLELYEADSTNLEIRALHGWYLRRAKRKTNDIAQDQEQRHFKHTLQNHDKHDRYSLTGMGNLYLATAREMRRETEQEKDRRHKMYERAVEFFDKALQLDPRNAYAAQGIGIAMAEDKKDFQAALQIFSKVRETIKEASVFVNLGHVYCEVKQYSRAIENYETALSRDRGKDAQVLACLGRAWLLRGKQERSVNAIKNSLDYSQRALQLAPEQVHFRFNVAFVELQIAQLLYALPEASRSLVEVEEAAAGLEDAIESLSAIAKVPNPPFPKHDIEQRANMGRNTMRKQLERAIQSQREYEEKNAARLQQARDMREAEMRKREDEKRKADGVLAEERRKIAEERQLLHERDRQLAEQRAEEDRRREAGMTTDSETGEKKQKRSTRKTNGKRKKKAEDVESDGTGTDALTAAASGEERTRKPKKRKLERRGGGGATKTNKYKSEEMIVDSDEDLAEESGADATQQTANGDAEHATSDMSVDEEAATSNRKKTSRVIEDEDEEEDDAELEVPDEKELFGEDDDDELQDKGNGLGDDSE